MRGQRGPRSVLLLSQPHDSSHMLREFNTLAPGRHACTCEDVCRAEAPESNPPCLRSHCWPLNGTPAQQPLPASPDLHCFRGECAQHKVAFSASLKKKSSARPHLVGVCADGCSFRSPRYSVSVHPCVRCSSKQNKRGYRRPSAV